MNAPLLYDVVSQIVNRTSLETRLRRVLRDCVLATVATRSCLLDDLAHALQPRGNYDSQYRRIQRFLANERVDVGCLQSEWATFVLQHLCQPATITLLVDETALSHHLKIMVVGIWTSDGCIPLAWRSYQSTKYPACGQVALIADLLDRIRPALPFPCPTTLLADQGIGTSPDLIRAVEQRGIDVLFRVQRTCHFRDAHGHEFALGDIGVPGQVWQAVGEVFKKAGWLELSACVAWDEAYDQPWCLVSTHPVDPHHYACRSDQEVSFRDLKSDGFQWHRSHVWLPDHADRLLLFLAIAYCLVLLVGQALPPVTSGRDARKSIFRRGLDALTACFRPTIAPVLPKPPLPPPHITCVVQ